MPTTTETITPDSLSRDEKSILLYAETCCVDYGGLLEGIRMNGNDIKALDRFKADGILDYGRVPGALLGTFQRSVTHWITFNDAAWSLAHALRRARAARRARHATRSTRCSPSALLLNQRRPARAGPIGRPNGDARTIATNDWIKSFAVAHNLIAQFRVRIFRRNHATTATTPAC